MAINYSITEQVQGSGITARKTQDKSGAAHVQIVETVATAQTDSEIALTLDVSEIVALYINSTQDVTLETNDGSSPDNTIALTADNPYIWHDESYHDCLLTEDVTALFITNASGATATITVWALYDPTP